MSSSRIYPFAKEFVKEDGNQAHVFTETAGGAEHYAASVFMYGATIRGINKGIVVPVWSADGTHSKVQRRGGGKVVMPSPKYYWSAPLHVHSNHPLLLSPSVRSCVSCHGARVSLLCCAE
jgi:hypothetical protein